MINLINNSSQPYLFINQYNNVCMLFCFCENLITRNFGSSSYSFRPWKIKLINLSDINAEASSVNTATYHTNLGNVIIEHNTHLIVDNFRRQINCD